MTQDFNVVGKTVPLKDAVERVTGAAKYVADVQLPNMLYAKILGSPYPHAIVKRIDTTRACNYPGVRAVITHEEVPEKTVPNPWTREWRILDQHLRCVGDEVVGIAAESEEAAEDALELVSVEYEVLPAVFDPIEAARPDAPKLWPDGNISDPEAKPYVLEWGSPGQALKEAEVVVEGTFRTPMIVHTPLEPHACIAYWEGPNLTAWISTQTPHPCRNALARYFDIPVSNVRVICHFVGGAFGGKYVERYPFIAALLARKAGRPVKLEFTRQEVHTISRRRYASVANVKLGAKNDGTLVAIDYECFYDVGACGNQVGGSCLFWESMPYVYRLQSARFKAWDMNTNLVTAQPFRAVPFPAYHFAVEQLLDILAEKLGISPVEVRLKNTRRTGEILEPYGQVLSDYRIEECLKKATEAIGWNEKWKGWGKQTTSGKKSRGIGIVTAMGWGNWVPDTTSAMVKVEVDGSATLLTGTQDIGTGSNTTLCQIVAEVLGLSMEDVNIFSGDTAATPTDGGAYASRTMVTGGRAAKRAAEDAKKKILEKAASVLGTKEEELDLRDKKVYFISDPANAFPISDILTNSITGSHSQELPEQVAPLRDRIKLGGGLAHAVELDVDLETGEVRLLKYVAVHDVGTAVNPSVVQNQIYGGVILGLGAALVEELVFDPERSVYVNPDFTDYKILTIGDVPQIEAVIVESLEPTGPFGAKGLGEHPNVLPPAAVANAIYQATGVRLMELPITPEKILRLMKGSGQER